MTDGLYSAHNSAIIFYPLLDSKKHEPVSCPVLQDGLAWIAMNTTKKRTFRVLYIEKILVFYAFFAFSKMMISLNIAAALQVFYW